MALKTFDDVRDMSVKIVNKLVEEGLIKDCTDTNDETEFKAQDAITAILCAESGIENEDE